MWLQIYSDMYLKLSRLSEISDMGRPLWSVLVHHAAVTEKIKLNIKPEEAKTNDIKKEVLFSETTNTIQCKLVGKPIFLWLVLFTNVEPWILILSVSSIGLCYDSVSQIRNHSLSGGLKAIMDSNCNIYNWEENTALIYKYARE
jgi:hypothetical protein